jgi:hypothetical protein
MLHTRWTLLEMRKDALQRDLPAPDEACARHHCLHEGVEAPDLATIKAFFFPGFYIDNDLNRLHEERQVKPDGRRIQLRIKPPKAPKITLQLTRPERVARATGSRKRA